MSCSWSSRSSPGFDGHTVQLHPNRQQGVVVLAELRQEAVVDVGARGRRPGQGVDVTQAAPAFLEVGLQVEGDLAEVLVARLDRGGEQLEPLLAPLAPVALGLLDERLGEHRRRRPGVGPTGRRWPSRGPRMPTRACREPFGPSGRASCPVSQIGYQSFSATAPGSAEPSDNNSRSRSDCGHSSRRPWPPMATSDRPVVSAASSNSSTSQCSTRSPYASQNSRPTRLRSARRSVRWSGDGIRFAGIGP